MIYSTATSMRNVCANALSTRFGDVAALRSLADGLSVRKSTTRKSAEPEGVIEKVKTPEHKSKAGGSRRNGWQHSKSVAMMSVVSMLQRRQSDVKTSLLIAPQTFCKAEGGRQQEQWHQQKRRHAGN